LSTLVPFAPDETKDTKVPEPSEAVLAGDVLAKALFGVNMNMGDVFAAIF
jgi:hypothetical protein